MKLSKRAIDALALPTKAQEFHWDDELKGFGVCVRPSGTKTFIVSYRTLQNQSRRMKIGRYGVFTLEEAKLRAKSILGRVADGADPADDKAEARSEKTVAELCDWYLAEARAGRILGRRNRPIKASTLDMDESRIRTHIKPLLGNRIASSIRISDVEGMQKDIVDGKTARARTGGRGGVATGGTGVAGRAAGTLQSVLSHADRNDQLKVHPSRGVRKLVGKRKKRRLSEEEIRQLGIAIQWGDGGGDHPTGIAIVKMLVLTGFRISEAQNMQRSWLDLVGGFVAFPDTKGDEQVRAIGPSAAAVARSQPVIAQSDYLFPSDVTHGPFTAGSACLARLCRVAGLKKVTPHTLRHTFGSVAGDLGFSELVIAALLGHGPQSVTQGYIHIDEALKLAVRRTSDRIAALLEEGAASARRDKAVKQDKAA